MNTRPLIITSDQLFKMAIVPNDAKIVDGGPTGTMKEFDGIYARISSQEFKLEDCDKPIELKANNEWT